MSEWWFKHTKSDLAAMIQKQEADLAAARAEIERMGRELNLAKYGEPDFSWSIHKEAMSEFLARAEKAEADRDEALAQVAMVYEVAAQTAKGEGESEFFNPVQAIRALTPADAKAALEAYGREKVREGMRRAYDLSGQYHQITHIRAAILADMETLK